jgi:hypothetical protein
MSSKLTVVALLTLWACTQVAADELTPQGKALAKALADPKRYDLDPAQWFEGLWSDPVTDDELMRESFVNKHRVRDGSNVLVWVYVETLFKASPAKLERQRWRISCAEEAAGVETSVDADGTAHVSKTPRMVPLAPDSVGWQVMEKACRK